jgi:hypothetical protein
LRFTDAEPALQAANAAGTSVKSPNLAGMNGEAFWTDNKIWHKHIIRFHQVRTIRGETSHQ